MISIDWTDLKRHTYIARKRCCDHTQLLLHCCEQTGQSHAADSVGLWNVLKKYV